MVPYHNSDEERWAVCDCIECRNGHFEDCPFECRRLIQAPTPREESAMSATEEQWQEQANAVEQFAAALAEGRVPAEMRWSAVNRLKSNVETLLAWTDR
jgi:hypothetical protein